MVQYYYIDGGTARGPLTLAELKIVDISRETKIWFYGLEDWVELSSVPELSDIASAVPPPINTAKAVPKKCNPAGISGEHKERGSVAPASINASEGANYVKWLGLVVIFVIATIIVMRVVLNQNNNSVYEQIVASSQESGGEFDVYVDKYFRDLEYFGIFPKRPSKTIIKLANIDRVEGATHIHGVSYGANNDDKIEIYINRSSWESFSKASRYLVMYHELSHDVLNVEDLPATSSNEMSLMYPQISSYESVSMDDFILSYKALFEQYASR